MKKEDAKILLLISTIACVYGCYLQIGFLLSYINDPDNPVRNENLVGMFLVSFIFSIAWIGSLILLVWKKSSFSTIERIIAFIPSLLIASLSFLSIAFDLSKVRL
jgi:hypothetical protein